MIDPAGWVSVISDPVNDLLRDVICSCWPQDLGEREGVVQGGEARLRSLMAQAESRERELDSRERAVLELQQAASGERQVCVMKLLSSFN